ncbi:MAG: sigma-54 dependent transcriptional regulator [bacterium]|jgi:DNA-binding NtrC family response regulator|nr:sigma-54 dependent transcriptional regulator [bacterium]
MLTTVLVADDKKSMREFLSEALQKEGYQVSLAADGEQALELFRELIPDIVITDIRMPGLNGLEFLKSMRDLDPEAVVIVITAYGSIETAVTAMKSGAYDYITKPFSIDELTVVMDKAKEQRRLVDENRRLRLELTKKYKFENIIGKSPKIQEVFDIMERVIPSKATVMLYGESGTGKELIARAIHYSGARKNGPFVKVNCAALPESLLESELFGHERGAFTGAIQRRQGRFELSDNGSIFLDEIGDISPTVQVRLLRVIQQREFERVGGAKTIQVDVRIIAATNRDLGKALEEGRFREDLYYRLNVVPIYLPALRERPGDIALLARYFLEQMGKEINSRIKYISPEAMEYMVNYRWPGNVREVENVIERALVICRGEIILPEDLPTNLTNREGRVSLDVPELGTITMNEAVETIEREMIKRALEKTGGVQTKSADLLGINRGSLIYKMKKYNLS